MRTTNIAIPAAIRDETMRRNALVNEQMHETMIQPDYVHPTDPL